MMGNFSSGDYDLVVRQKPLTAKVFLGKEKGMQLKQQFAIDFLIVQ
jgi:hypothetical protein